MANTQSRAQGFPHNYAIDARFPARAPKTRISHSPILRKSDVE
jgi:hypothetical protein